MGKVYACSDIHGCYWAWEQIKEILQPEDILYFLGDAIDRGNDGFDVLCEMLTDDRVHFIRGNHEDMMYNYYRFGKQTWTWNDYEATKSAIEAYHDDELLNIVLELIRRLPYTAEYINTNGEHILMSHSGYWPFGEIRVDSYDYLWDRYHYKYDYTIIPANTYIIHGHTPVQLMCKYWGVENINDEDMNEAFWYNGGNKCNLDCGTVWSNKCALLDLDTLETTMLTNQGAILC